MLEILKPTEKELKDISARMTNTFKELEKAKDTPRRIAEEVAQYMLPELFGWEQRETERFGLSTKIYDGEAIAAHSRLSDGYFGWLCSPSIDWLKMIPGKKEDGANLALMSFLQNGTSHLLLTFARGNFYEAVITGIKTASIFGTAVTMYDEDPDGYLSYNSLPFEEFYISENRYGVADVLYRKFKIKSRQFLEEFFDDIGDNPELKTMLEQADEKEITLLNAVYPTGKNSVLIKTERPFVSAYQVVSGQGLAASVLGKMGSPIIRVKGMSQPNFNAWRFEKVPRSAYGTCPGFKAIYDVKMLNIQSKALADREQLEAKPPIYASESLEGQLHIFPGGVTIGPDGAKPEPIFTGSNLNAKIDAMERRAKIIRDHMKNDYFQSISAIQNSSRERTETEILEIKAEAAATLGASLGRIQMEFLGPMVKRTMIHEIEKKRFPEADKSIKPDVDLDIEFISPLAQAQRKAVKIGSIMTGLQAVAQLASVDQDVFMNVNTNWAAREILLTSGYPADGIESEETVLERRDAAAQARAEMAEREMRAKEMSAMNNAGKAPEPGSPLQKQMEAGVNG